MDIPESKVHSFIVKLWMEDDETQRAVWHGYITHVPDGARSYLKELGDIISFIQRYVVEMTPRRRSLLKPWTWSRRKR